MYDIMLDDVTKTYRAGVAALDHLSLTIHGGEFFSVVGPSGCGKTTALRIIAGLEKPSSGRVFFGERDVTELDTQRRNLGLITQANLLLQHRTARRNIRFPIEVRDRHTNSDAGERVELEAADLHIGHLLDRKPSTLSEGERRLVQLARAIIASPSTLLMDEPLASLDDQMRSRLRSDIRRIHQTRGMTILLITASQHDAMAMSDRIGVLFDGVIHQIGSPDDVYSRPATAEVARFFGEPPMNVVRAKVRVSHGERNVDVLGRTLGLWTPLLDEYHGRSILVGFRPEDLIVGESASKSIAAAVSATEPLGHATLTRVLTTDGTTIACTLPGGPAPIGTILDLGLRSDILHLFDPDTELAILHPASQR